MSGGWYKQLRNIPERAWFKDANMVLLYTALKATAYVADGKYEGQIIRRGSCPTTRADLMEITGLKRMTLDRCLKKLIGYGEIIVKSSNQFSIISICDYDSYGTQESLFSATDGITIGNTDGITDGNPTPIYNIKEERREEDTLISHSIPYKNERESKDVALEVKKRYNKEFTGMLPPCIRLSTSTRIAVEECLRRFGSQSVDMVFQQIKSEKFHLGDNKTGFIANFSFIFTPKNYQQYLERAQLARQKKATVPDGSPSGPQLSKEERDALRDQNRRETLQSLVESLKKLDHRPVWYSILVSAYESGELAQYGIDWKPTNNA